MIANVTRTLLASAAGIGMLLATAGQPASAGTVRVYATNSGGDNLHVIDPSTNKVEFDHQGHRGRPWRGLLARRHPGLCQQRSRFHA